MQFPNLKIVVFQITQPYTLFSSRFMRETLRIVVEASDFDSSIIESKSVQWWARSGVVECVGEMRRRTCMF